MLSVVIPIRNGTAFIQQTTEAVLLFLESYGSPAEGELIFVSDGCTDQPEVELKSRLEKDSRVRLERLGQPCGKGAAVRRGVLAARGDRVAYLDVDLSARPEMLVRLLAALDHGTDFACGSRHHVASRITVSQGLARVGLGWLFRRLVRAATGLEMSDTQCGCKAFLRQPMLPIFEQMKEPGFAFDIELLLEARHRKLVIEEIPIDWADGVSSSVKPVRDGIQMLSALIRLANRDRARNPDGGNESADEL
ncbi:MAG: glycosyltransferase [Planctomycetota bacterium]|nr:glycosyltransferase [Planctomycetota bacterium]